MLGYVTRADEWTNVGLPKTKAETVLVLWFRRMEVISYLLCCVCVVIVVSFVVIFYYVRYGIYGCTDGFDIRILILTSTLLQI